MPNLTVCSRVCVEPISALLPWLTAGSRTPFNRKQVTLPSQQKLQTRACQYQSHPRTLVGIAKEREPRRGRHGDFPKLGVPCLGVPLIRTIVYWGLYWGPLILGSYHMGRSIRESSLRLGELIDDIVQVLRHSGVGYARWGLGFRV